MTDPTPTTPLILLTGSTGFIGSRILSDLLSANHRVRASVRRPEQIPLLTSRHSSPAESGQLQFAVIPSLDDTAAVRVAISNDVTCVIHLASPMPGKGEDFESDYLKPAVKGTETVLEAARGTRVGRVVVMSSVLAMVPLGGLEMEGLHVEEGANPSISLPHPFTFPSPGAKYAASKILAHRATLAWAAQHRSSLTFDILTIHPTFVLGRDLTFSPSRQGDLPPGINGWVIRSLGIPPPGKPLIPAVFVDVGDVSNVVLRTAVGSALPVRKGEVTEVLVSGRETSWEEVVRFVREKFPELEVRLEGPFVKPMTVDTTRAERALGVKWREVEGMLGDVLGQFAEGGGKGNL